MIDTPRTAGSQVAVGGSPTGASVQITLDRNDQLLSGGREQLAELMQVCGADAASAFEAQLALKEILSNALQHGKGRRVRLRFAAVRGAVMLAVTYSTTEFTPALGRDCVDRSGAPTRGIPTIRAMAAKGGGSVQWRFGTGIVTVRFLKRWAVVG